MAYENTLQTDSFIAGADLSALQYTFVGLNSSGQAVAPSAAGVLAVGVLQNAPKAGEAATVAFGGVTKIKLAATLAPNASVATDANGAAVAASGAGTYIAGLLTIGGDDGQVGSMVLKAAGPLAA